MSADPRNDLYKLYARFLQKYQPKMFVFENVMGIKSANGGATWLKVQEALRSVGYEIECHEQNSKNFGVLKMRLSPHWRSLMIRMFAILNRQMKNNLIFTGFMPV